MTIENYEQLPTKPEYPFIPPTLLPRGAHVAWLAIRMHFYDGDNTTMTVFPFELLGVFTGDNAEQAAIAVCERRYDLVMPAQINTVLGNAICGYYPLVKGGE